MRLRPPRDARDLFRMLAFYESPGGLDAVIARFDFDHVAPWHLDRIVLGAASRRPRPEASTDITEYCKELLSSRDFRRLAIRNFLDAFADKPRLLFVHIPKTAGTDLTNVLSARHFAIDSAIENPNWFTQDALFRHLRELTLACEFADTIFVRGHARLRYYVNQNLIRPGDQVFTIVRDPIDVVISGVNYRLTRLMADPTGRDTDTRLWLRDLGLQRVPQNPSQVELLGLAKRILREPRVIEDNVLCMALGNGDAASALANIVASDIEITDLIPTGRTVDSMVNRRDAATCDS